MSASCAPAGPATLAAPVTSLPVPDADVRFFVDQGFLVAPDLIRADELTELKADLVRLARGDYPCPSLKPVPAGLSDAQVLERILCIHQPHYVSPVARRFAEHPRVAAVLSRLCGAHLPHWDGSVKCMQTMMFAKPPGKPGQAWHQDERYIPTRDRSLIGAWIAIDDATIDNGCLWVLPGSHRNGYMYPCAKPTDLDEYDGSDQCHGFDESAAQPVEVRAGSVVFFNGYLLHKSLKNRSQAFRRVLVSHYMNAWSLLPWHNVTQADGRSVMVGIADVRTVFPVAGRDPYADKGYDEPIRDVWLRDFNPAGPASSGH